MKKYILSTLLSFFFVTSFSQETVDFRKFNEEKLALYISEGINKVRDTMMLEELSNDVILQKSSDFHLDYVIKEGKLVHYQSKDKFKKPINRVREFGGKHNIVTENLAYQKVPSNEYTYLELANRFVTDWVGSPGHFRNIKDSRVTEFGLSVKYDSKSGRIYAVQVFGHVNSVTSFLGDVPTDAYGIDYNNEKYEQKCTRCQEVMARKPAEVLYGIYNYDGEIVFSINDPEYFFKIFQNSGDGIAVDIMSRDQYACGKKNMFANSPVHRGYLLPPVYLKEMKANATQDEQGNVFVKIGDVPEKLKGKDIELNMLLIQDKFLCIYNPFFDIPGSRWDLLDMGMFMDSVSKSKSTSEQVEVTIKRQMKFEIPFEKNVSSYSPEDIQPIYDSLKLTRYTIKRIDIRAYSSVEGSTERNIVLQEKRAASIVEALSQIQAEEIPQTIVAKENWVEFYQDVVATRYQHFSQLGHDDVKVELKNEKVNQDLEVILSKHRKAVVFLDVERKSMFAYTSPEKTVEMFNSSLSENDLETAMEIQQEVYEKIQDHTAPANLLDKLELPKKKEYGLLLNNKILLGYKLDSARVRKAINALLELERLIPKSAEVKYNIAALELRAWALNDPNIFPDRLHKSIQQLSGYAISQELITRMNINYHIIYSEYLMRDRKYKEKNRVIGLINMQYKKMNMTNEDVLNLAQYFVSYNAYDQAIQLLHPYVIEVDVDEDLLFYYLNLTIIDNKITAQDYYKTIMMNAVNINQKRFCKLFNTFGEGGITFQLLDNLYLKRTYCEFCE